MAAKKWEEVMEWWLHKVTNSLATLLAVNRLNRNPALLLQPIPQFPKAAACLLFLFLSTHGRASTINVSMRGGLLQGRHAAGCVQNTCIWWE